MHVFLDVQRNWFYNKHAGTAPSVRPATEKELADYRRIQRKLVEENKFSETP